MSQQSRTWHEKALKAVLEQPTLQEQVAMLINVVLLLAARVVLLEDVEDARTRLLKDTRAEK